MLTFVSIGDKSLISKLFRYASEMPNTRSAF